MTRNELFRGLGVVLMILGFGFSGYGYLFGNGETLSERGVTAGFFVLAFGTAFALIGGAFNGKEANEQMNEE